MHLCPLLPSHLVAYRDEHTLEKWWFILLHGSLVFMNYKTLTSMNFPHKTNHFVQFVPTVPWPPCWGEVPKEPQEVMYTHRSQHVDLGFPDLPHPQQNELSGQK